MTPEEELKQTIEKIGTAVETLRKAQDDELKEVKKGMADFVTADKLLKLNKSVDDLIETKSKLEKALDAQTEHNKDLEAKLNRLSLSGTADEAVHEQKMTVLHNRNLKSLAGLLNRPQPADVDVEGMKAYRAGFLNFLRKGKDDLEPEERKAMSAGADPDGGYLVTPDASGRIVTRIFETSPMRQVAAQQTIGTSELEGIRDTDEAASGGWVSETGARAVSNTPQIGKWKIQVHEVFAQPEATQQLLDDANIDVEGWLAGKVADKLTRVENAAFVTGTGAGQPRGFASYTTAATADASRAWGILEHVVSGANGDFAASNPADKLFDLIGAFKQGYLNNATWATKREVIAKIRKFKEATTNAYIWQPGLQRGQPQEILGYPVIMFEDMAALATGSLSMALGDFRLAYQIVDRQGFRVIRDNLTNKPYVRFYTTRRVGGDVVQFEALKFIKFST